MATFNIENISNNRLTISYVDCGYNNFYTKQLDKLKNCQAHSSCILSEVDLNTYKKLGIQTTEEPISYIKKINVIK